MPCSRGRSVLGVYALRSSAEADAAADSDVDNEAGANSDVVVAVVVVVDVHVDAAADASVSASVAVSVAVDAYNARRERVRVRERRKRRAALVQAREPYKWTGQRRQSVQYGFSTIEYRTQHKTKFPALRFKSIVIWSKLSPKAIHIYCVYIYSHSGRWTC